MLQLHPTNRNTEYCCTESAGMSVQVSSPGIITKGSADIFTIAQVLFCGTEPVYESETKQLCLEQLHETSRHVAISIFKCCFEPTGMFVEVASDHLARRLQLNSTSMHICLSCIYQQICLNQLQLTYKHICSCVAEPTGIYVTLASDAQIRPYARTQLTGW